METSTVTNSSVTVISSQYDAVWDIFKTGLKFFNKYIIIVFIVFGFCGNILSVIIFRKHSKQDRASASYLVPLALFDICNIMVAFVYWLGHGGIHVMQYATSKAACFVYMFFMYHSIYLSGWTIVAFSCERCLAVWFPLQMAPLMTSKTRRNIICSLFVCSPLYIINIVNDPVYFPNSNDRGCLFGPDASTVSRLLFVIIACGFGILLPCVIVTVVNILILIGLSQGNQQRGTMTATKCNSISEGETRCIRNLIFITFFYIIFLFPFGIVFSILRLVPLENLDSKISDLAVASVTWSSLNYVINPVIYSFSLPFYRREALHIFCKPFFIEP